MSRHTPKKRRKHRSTSSSSEEESTNFNPVEEDSTSFTTDKFVCPDKFQKLKPTYDTLCLEDLKGNTNKELWLIRAPLNFDCSLLDGEKLIPNAQYKLGDTQFEAIVKETKQVGNITAVLPSKKRKKLLPGPAFKGLISVISSVEVAPVHIPISPPKMSFDIPPGLQQRYTPFGCGSPSKKRKKKHKSRKGKEEDEPFRDSVIRIKEEKDILDTSSSKKKKRKKDKRNTKQQEVETNMREETESEENGVIIAPTEIKKENDVDEEDFIIDNIKQEPEEMVVDELNLTRKSTKKKKKKKHKDD